tara:strand:+ start:272 stop:610 length:339 start_codon:yes stop_codon:yes gene_type:complete
MNLFGCDIDFNTIPEATVQFNEIQDEILDVQTMEGRGKSRARRAVKATTMLFLLRCSKMERALPMRVDDGNGNMIINAERTEWKTFKKDCKKQYDQMLEAKDAILQVLDNVW